MGHLAFGPHGFLSLQQGLQQDIVAGKTFKATANSCAYSYQQVQMATFGP